MQLSVNEIKKLIQSIHITFKVTTN